MVMTPDIIVLVEIVTYLNAILVTEQFSNIKIYKDISYNVILCMWIYYQVKTYKIGVRFKRHVFLYDI